MPEGTEKKEVAQIVQLIPAAAGWRAVFAVALPVVDKAGKPMRTESYKISAVACWALTNTVRIVGVVGMGLPERLVPVTVISGFVMYLSPGEQADPNVLKPAISRYFKNRDEKKEEGVGKGE